MGASLDVIKVAQKFEISVKSFNRIRAGVYRLTSSETSEEYCLKRMNVPVDYLRWVDQSLCSVRDQSFERIAWRNPDRPDGTRLYVRAANNTAPYILAPWIDGRVPNVRSRIDMGSCAEALARFHTAGKVIEISSKGKQNFLGQWPELLQKRMALIKRHVSRAKKQTSGEIDLLLKSHGDQILERATRALELLRKSDYPEVCKDEKYTALCHGDSTSDNFVIAPNGVWLIDFETLRIDLRVYDMFRLVRFAGKKGGWDFTITQAILDRYRSVSELDRSEYLLLHVWLLFPFKVAKLLRGYNPANKKKQALLLDKFKKTLANEQEIATFLKQLDEYVMRR